MEASRSVLIAGGSPNRPLDGALQGIRGRYGAATAA